MAMDSKIVTIKLLLDSGQYEEAMNQISQMTGGVGKTAEDEALGGIMNLQAGAVMVANKVGEVFKAAGEQIQEAMQKASQYEETHSKLLTVFSSIKSEAQAMATELKNGFGMSGLEAEKLLAATGDLLVGFQFSEESALGLSMEVQKLSADLASFQNLQGGAAQASEIITKAMLGERDALVSLGVKISETDLKQKALALGYKVGKDGLDKQTQAQVTLKLIMEQSAKAMGDFQRTENSFANQQKILKANLEDVQVELGQKFMPLFAPWIKMVNDAYDSQKSLDAKTTDLIETYKQYKETIDLLKTSQDKLTEAERQNLLIKKDMLEIQLQKQLNEFRLSWNQWIQDSTEKVFINPMLSKFNILGGATKFTGAQGQAQKDAIAYYKEMLKAFSKEKAKFMNGKGEYGGWAKVDTSFKFEGKVFNPGMSGEKSWKEYSEWYRYATKQIQNEIVLLGETKNKGDLTYQSMIDQLAMAVRTKAMTLDEIIAMLEGFDKADQILADVKSRIVKTPTSTDKGNLGGGGPDGPKGKSPEEMELERLKAQYKYLEAQNVWNIELITNLKEQEAVLTKIQAGLTEGSTEYYKVGEEILKNKEDQAKLEEETALHQAKRTEGVKRESSANKENVLTLEDTLEQLDAISGYVSEIGELFGGEVSDGIKKFASGIEQTAGLLQTLGVAGAGVYGGLIAGFFGLLSMIDTAVRNSKSMPDMWESLTRAVDDAARHQQYYNTILQATADTLSLIKKAHEADNKVTKDELQAQQTQREGDLDDYLAQIAQQETDLNNVFIQLYRQTHQAWMNFKVDADENGNIMNLEAMDDEINRLALYRQTLQSIKDTMDTVDIDSDFVGLTDWVRDEDRANFERIIAQARDLGIIEQNEFNAFMNAEKGWTNTDLKEMYQKLKEEINATYTAVDNLIVGLGEIKTTSGNIIDAQGDVSAFIEQIAGYDAAERLSLIGKGIDQLRAQADYLKAIGVTVTDENSKLVQNILDQIALLEEQLSLTEDQTEKYGIMTQIAQLRAEVEGQITSEIAEQITLTEELQRLIEGARFDTENLFQIRQAMTEYQRQGFSQAEAAAEMAKLGVTERLVDNSKNHYGDMNITLNEATGDNLDERSIERRTKGL